MKLLVLLRKTLYVRAGICWIAAAGLWGILYPDLLFNKDVCRIVEETESGQGKEKTSKETDEWNDDLEDILNAGRDKIRIKCKIWEEMKNKIRDE